MQNLPETYTKTIPKKAVWVGHSGKFPCFHNLMDKQRLGVSLTKNTADRSGGVAFSFSFFCDCCGKEWASKTVPFTSGGFTANEAVAGNLGWCYHNGYGVSISLLTLAPNLLGV